MLLGNENLVKLARSKVMIFGLGGVGSYVVEALARSGVGTLILVDGDVFGLSNINRQLGATLATVGRLKTEVMSSHIRDINIFCEVKIFSEFYHDGDFDKFFTGEINFVVDAIDDIKAKVDLLVECYRHNIPVISAMGMGNKLDPSKLMIADIKKTSGCPLARSVRTRLKKFGISNGITVVYSTEQPIKVGGSTPGSMVFVPGSAGLLMAGYVVSKIVGE